MVSAKKPRACVPYCWGRDGARVRAGVGGASVSNALTLRRAGVHFVLSLHVEDVRVA